MKYVYKKRNLSILKQKHLNMEILIKTGKEEQCVNGINGVDVA